LDYWTTLSGWSKVSTPASDTAKKESIEESRRLAMNLFWNFNGCSSSEEGTHPDGSAFSYSESIDMDDGDYSEIEFHRDGSPTSEENKVPYERVCYDRFTADSTNETLFITVRVERMYDGDTSDEDNFIGYGLWSDLIGATTTYSDFFLRSTGDDTYDKNAYVEIDDMHFVASALFYNVDSATITSDGSSVTAHFTNSGGDQEETVTIDSLDFYTYS